MNFSEKIYDKSPIAIQNIMIGTAGVLFNRKRYGVDYYKFLAFLREFDYYTLEQQIEYRNRELQRFLLFAVENSPFYRELYREIDISSIKTPDDLRQLPVVDKEMLRQNMARIYTVPKHLAYESHTGGTTGKSLSVLITVTDMMQRMAVLDHFKERVGFKSLQMRRATFNGKHIIPPSQRKKVFWRYNFACKQMIYSSFHITEENIPFYIASLNKLKPQALDGFFTSICDIASYIERHNIQIDFQPVAIFPTSETLTSTGRALLERVFHCKVYDQYSSSEAAPFVTECPKQQLHIEMPTGVFEVLPENDNEVLVTSFQSHGTPLIRYRIGDRMVFSTSEKISDCSMAAPRVESIEGRRLDFLYTPDGAKINGGNIANLFKNMPNSLIHAQLIQNSKNKLKIALEVDKSKFIPAHDDLLRSEVLHKFGADLELIIEHVDEIPREKSGKFRMIINNVENSGEKQI